MSIPITGIILIPLGLLIAISPWRICLLALPIFATLSPAAVVNYGSFGLQPGYYLSILLIARTGVEIMVGGFKLNASLLTSMRPLFMCLVLAVVVLFVALTFFQGRVETLPGTSGFKSNATRPFFLARENFTQLIYLILNLLLLYSLGHQAARRGFREILKAWDLGLVLGLCFAAVVCFWQFASLYGGVPFPGDFFYSNAGYPRAENQTLVGLFRINGPFEEPATLGYAFTGYLLFSWARYRLYPTVLSAVLIALCGLCILISTSTTAFFGAFVCACVALLDVATGRIHLVTRTLSGGQIAAIGMILCASVLGVVLFVDYWSTIYAVLKSTVFEKSESTSFQERSFADFLAMQILVETYGLGIGLGSHKANSLVLTLLSNLGVMGLILFCAFLYLILRGMHIAFDRYRSELRDLIAPFQWGVAGLVLIHIFSNPNLSTLILWVQMGGVLALQLVLRRDPMAQPQPTIERLTPNPAPLTVAQGRRMLALD